MMEENNANKELVEYSDFKLGFLVEKYAGESGIMTWSNEANEKIDFLELDQNFEEKEYDRQGCVIYFDNDSDSEVEPLSNEDNEGKESSNDDVDRSGNLGTWRAKGLYKKNLRLFSSFQK